MVCSYVNKLSKIDLDLHGHHKSEITEIKDDITDLKYMRNSHLEKCVRNFTPFVPLTYFYKPM